jgi:hypothetical protein
MSRRRRGDEAALALDRLDDHAGHVLGADVDLDLLLDVVGAGDAAVGVGEVERAAVAVGVRDPVDLARKRLVALLVGRDLAGHGQGEQGAAVEGVVEHDHRGAARGGPGDLDDVLGRLGAGVHQQRPLVVVARGDAVEGLGHGHVRLVHHRVLAGVQVALHLVLDRLDDRRRGVAGVQHPQAPGEVDEAVAVDVLQDRPVGGGRVHRGHGGHPPGHRLATPLLQGPAARARDLAGQLPHLRQAH